MVWDTTENKLVTAQMTTHEGNIFSVRFLPMTDDHLVVSGAFGGRVLVRDITQEREIDTCTCHSEHRVMKLATVEDSPHVFYSCGEDGKVRLHDLRVEHDCSSSTLQNMIVNISDIRNPFYGSCGVNSIAMRPHRPWEMLIASQNPYVALFDLRMISNENPAGLEDAKARFAPQHIRTCDYSSVTNAAWNFDGTQFVATYSDDFIYLFDASQPPDEQREAVDETEEAFFTPREHIAEDEVQGSSSSGTTTTTAIVQNDQVEIQSRKRTEREGEEQDVDDEEETDAKRRHLEESATTSSSSSSSIESSIEQHNSQEQQPSDFNITADDIHSAVQIVHVDSWEQEDSSSDSSDSSSYDDDDDRINFERNIRRESSSDDEVMISRGGEGTQRNNFLNLDETGSDRTFVQVFKGHRNSDTIKEVNFMGPRSEFVISGSDDGNIFIWRKSDATILNVLDGDEHVVNVVQPHPTDMRLVASGIDDTIKIFEPIGFFDDCLDQETIDSIVSANMERMQQSDRPFRISMRRMMQFMMMEQAMVDAGELDEDTVPCGVQ
eukprot:TRINITY_DN1897_c1_g1_i21.p1 TRINITY_DN1897_c1_g1~~TRINITY_DN1897_c1_g1_i21.p1  ORF type:complete len:550 (-),score=156.32 TRINITY_DN1897_c1_g1_i21:1583-3232(-)